ncbi:hypothetical protein PC115_g25370 [Phytophthora cactorum]|uniref:IclR-ED domain-containing protein n=1 Tax=Phytophthora cactorum TaxID=29920 RepID=A0A8T1A122_9STRA|nr:hypothetical protein PC115_g25370 [Phytophthora cactorum]
MGKVLLAFSPPSVLEQYLEHNKLTPVTSSSIVLPSKLKLELENIRKVGYATDMEESCEGLRCIGAPIYNAVGEIEGAIGISGPIFRMSKNHMNRYNKKLLEQVQYISELLGYDPHRKG